MLTFPSGYVGVWCVVCGGWQVWGAGGWSIEKELADIGREVLGPRKEGGRPEQHISTTSSFYVENSDIGTRSKQTS